jgi:hypothetical protein
MAARTFHDMEDAVGSAIKPVSTGEQNFRGAIRASRTGFRFGKARRQRDRFFRRRRFQVCNSISWRNGIRYRFRSCFT